MRQLLLRSLKAWLPLAAAVTVLAGLVYALDQQNLRQGANDPQIQMAEDAAARLATGAAAGDVIPPTSPRVDIARSLAPFLIVYDSNDRPLASTALLDGTVPLLPDGVAASARATEDRVTWQPRDGVRIAAVVVSYAGGTVLAGRSLRVVEDRASEALATAAAAWLVAMVGTLAACAIVERLDVRYRRAPR